MESLLKRQAVDGGKDNPYESWKSVTRYWYDNSMVYSFCYDIRNCIEHEQFFINLVNVDLKRGVGGFAINLENEIFDTNLKKATKQKLRDFLIKRKAEGLSPWISVAKTVQTFCMQLDYLYAFFLKIMIDKTIPLAASAQGELEELMPFNCIVRDMPPMHPNDTKPAKRIYRISPIVLPAFFQDRAQYVWSEAEELSMTLN